MPYDLRTDGHDETIGFVFAILARDPRSNFPSEQQSGSMRTFRFYLTFGGPELLISHRITRFGFPLYFSHPSPLVLSIVQLVHRRASRNSGIYLNKDRACNQKRHLDPNRA
ncbi:hypothetical protein EVAR_100397_1 [Eumeta japonica]|uniref:Uncharacterized protein n=1 Tax=Eumeta variegata TaxID=151549 RepID=A0A4C2ACL9_EUMVA|nr:hypothetical protein EVAR_100397_1 [Eumeta japonica]